MRKSEDAVIHMQQAFDRIKWLVGDKNIFSNMKCIPVLTLFDEKIILFLDELSRSLMSDSAAKKYPDIMAYAFWIRKASMARYKEIYFGRGDHIGRGIVFHVAPSNIPVQFAISLTYALVSGNMSVVRVSNKEFQQVSIICAHINKVIGSKYPDIAPYITIVRYDHDDDVTQLLSDECDVRMIWGGDRTIEKIRESRISARCLDFGFADRYSLSVIDSDSYLKMDPITVAEGFYNDTYFSDQNACSSPRMIIWIGNSKKDARRVFWGALADLVHKNYELDPMMSSDKLLNIAICASHYADLKVIKDDNYVVRVELPELYTDIMKYKGNCGFFFEYEANNMEELAPVLKKECQTLTYIGEIEEQIRRVITENGVRGVDRIVPVGHGTDISLIWDGIDIPLALSRVISRN